MSALTPLVLRITEEPFAGGYGVRLEEHGNPTFGTPPIVTPGRMTDALWVAMAEVRAARKMGHTVKAAPICRDFGVSVWLDCEHLGTRLFTSRREAYAYALEHATAIAVNGDPGLEGACYVTANSIPAGGYMFDTDGSGASVEPVDWA